MDAEWSDKKKWWMDLAKSAITFTVAACVSLFLIDRVQETRAIDKARADAFYTSRLKALDEYRTASVSYDLAAHTAYTELYQWHGRVKTPAMLRYEQEEYPKWKLSLEKLDHLFEVKDQVTSQLATASERDRLFRRWINKRLDNKDRDDTSIEPFTTRVEFDELTAKSACQRAELIANLQQQLFPTKKSAAAAANSKPAASAPCPKQTA